MFSWRFFSLSTAIQCGVLCCVLTGMGNSAATAAPIILFNSTTGDTPTDDPWRWLYGGDGGSIGAASSSVMNYNLTGGVMLLDTADPHTDRGGYFMTSGEIASTGVNLNRQQGFALSFNLQILNELHADSNSAGFGITLLTSDNWGIELNFWNDLIFADNADFTHGEQVAFDTTANIVNYTLSVFDDHYCLFAPGMDSPLVGSLRQYAPSANSLIPYGQSNYLFFGDNSGNASAQVLFSQVGYTEVPPGTHGIPEPSHYVMLGIAVVVVAWRVGRKLWT
ncbi:MAG: hypothetical protein SFX18_09065 [Pirellulales bacterium]|nr:hypothetical protein [Pirellulales bacterium]